MLRTISLLALAALALVCTASPVLAAGGPGPAPAPLLASYWRDFLDHWGGVFKKQNGVVMGAILVGILCLFIITRGKWKK